MSLLRVVTLTMLVGFVFIISGCKGKVGEVKDSSWRGDKGIPIGKALDKYKYFESTEWKLTKTDNGREFVDFSGTLSTTETMKNIDKPINEGKASNPNIEKVLNNQEELNGLYTAITMGGNFGIAASMGTVVFVVANDVKNFINNNGRYVLNIRFKIDKNNKDKEKSADIESISISDKATKTEIIKDMSENSVLENIFKEKQLYGKDNLDGDAYWNIGLKIFMAKAEEHLKKQAAEGQRQFFGR